MATRMQQRRGLASQWTTANPVLAAGEIGYETDTGKFKIGDGINTWSLLKYFLNLDALDIDADGFITDDKRGVANGVASLDTNGLIPVSQLPDEHLTDKINTKIAEVVGAAPSTLNTLTEIAAAFDNDPNYADTITAALALKAEKESPSLTGTPTAPTATVGTDTTQIATTAFVQDAVEIIAANVASLDNTVSVQVDGRLDTLETDLSSANANIVLMDTSIQTIQSDINTINTDITTLQTNDESLNNSVVSLDSRLDSAESTITLMQGSISTLNASDSTTDASILAIDGRLDAVEADVATITSNVSALDTRIDNNDTSIVSLQSSASTLEASMTSAEGRLNTAEADIIALETQTENSDTHIAASLNVHGIANTADLATKSYADNAKTDAISTSATAIALKADIASPTFTGTPAAPTATAGTNTTQIATTAFVNSAIESVVGAAPAALDTLAEIATSLNNNADIAGTLTTGLAAKAPSASPTFTGTVALPAASSVTLDGTALSETLATKADNNSVINTMSGSHTISAADVNNIREMSGGGTISIPADNSFWPVGAVVDVIQTGSSQVTVAGGSGVTVNATPGLKLRAQWSSATILKRAANTFVVMGDLSA